MGTNINMKPKIFIGSSVEALDIAEAIQMNLEHIAYATVWNQGIFNLSNSTLEDLLETLENFDYGIFVFQPDDKSVIRKEKANIVRDNVIFELGLFYGKLGKDRVFYLTPRNYAGLHLPTDLGGITPGTYDYERLQKDRNIQAIVGSFCAQIKQRLKKDIPKKNYIGIKRAKLFNNFTNDFEKLIMDSEKVILFFIHSRQWRENNETSLDLFLKKEKAHLLVFLPNFLNIDLMDMIKNNFSDGTVIEPLVIDAFNYFLELKKEFANRVEIRTFNYYPTYSFYCFDKEAIIALYPTTSKKKNVPSFEIVKDTIFWNFFEDDLNELKRTSKLVSKKIIEKLKK